MELTRLKNLLLIAECGSLTAAAKDLYISPVSLREQVNHLEDELGFPVFSRDHQGMHLTEAGALFLENVKPHLMEIQDLIIRCRQIASPVLQKIRVAIYPPYDFNRYCTAFLTQHPGVLFEYGESNFDAQSDTAVFMKENRYDIMQECYSPSFSSQGLAFLPIRQEAYCCFVAASHPLSKRNSISLSELKGKTVYSTLALSLDVRLLAKRCRQAGVPLHQVPDDDFNFLRICTSGDIYLAEEGLAQVFTQFSCIPITPCIPLIHGIVYPANPPDVLRPFLQFVIDSIGQDQLLALSEQCRISCEALHIPCNDPFQFA